MIFNAITHAPHSQAIMVHNTAFTLLSLDLMSAFKTEG